MAFVAKTPTKVFKRTVNDVCFCVLCARDICDNRRKVQLLKKVKGNICKTTACQNLEIVIGPTFSADLGDVVCINCAQVLGTCIKKLKSIQQQYKETQEKRPSSTCIVSKRLLAYSPAKLKKKNKIASESDCIGKINDDLGVAPLSYISASNYGTKGCDAVTQTDSIGCNPNIEISVRWDAPGAAVAKHVYVGPTYHKIIRAMATCSEVTVVKELLGSRIKDTVVSEFCNIVRSVVATYCKRENNYSLRSQGKGKDKLASFSFHTLHEELREVAPSFLAILKAACINPRQGRNADKKGVNILPGILSTAAKVVNIHCKDMNILKQITSLIMKKGGMKKSAFKRLASTYDCMSYGFVSDLQDKFSDRFDGTILRWKEEAENSEHSGFSVASDNVDWELGPRHMTVDSQKKSIHKINAVAYKHRISSSHLPDDGPQSDIKTLPMTDFLPGMEHNRQLAGHLVILIGNLWAEEIPSLVWFKNHLPATIVHPYIKQMKRKTEKTQLGCYHYDQKSTDDVQEFLTEISKAFLPHYSESDDDSQQLPKTIMFADYLGFERQKKAQRQVQDARTPSHRLEGVTSALSDFHAQAEFHKLVWHYLYDTYTEKEVGTLCHAKQATKSNDVTSDPHRDFYAAENLLDKFTRAYLIEGALHHFGMDSTDGSPTRNNFDASIPAEEYVRNEVGKFLEEHVLNPPPCQPGDNVLKCRFCGKIYKQRKRLDTHEKQHHDLLAKKPSKGFQCLKCGKVYAKESGLAAHERKHENQTEVAAQFENEDDYVYNYTRRVLALLCLRLNLEDAIKRGDGERLMLCYRFMYLYCKESGCCPKYAYGLLETVAQTHCLLSERNAHSLTWNRFVNNKGREDSNMPVDLDVEHLNRPLKTDVHTYRGSLTNKTLQRISRSVEESERVMKNFDKQTRTKRDGGKHTTPNFVNDIALLVSLLHEKRVYICIPGRQHQHIGCISASPLATMDVKSLHNWMRKSLSEFGRKHYYQ